MEKNPEAFKRMNWKKGTLKPRQVVPQEQIIAGASEESIANFAEAMDAAKAKASHNPPKPRRWRWFFRRR